MKKNSFSPFDEILFRMRMGTCVALMVCSFPVFAQDAGQAQGDQSSEAAAVEKPKSEEVVLPGAEVRAQKETAEHISQEQMTERGDTNLIEAIRWVPGITTNTGHQGYDSGGFGVRGYGGTPHDGDHLALFVDGVPMLDSYEGRIDYNSILTGGLESIDVAKGYNSVLMGPNNIGGALNVRTAKPKKEFELAARTGFTFDGGGFSGNTDSLTVGTRHDLFYAQVGFDGNFINHWRLPSSFEPLDDTPPEAGGNPQKKGNRFGSESTNVGARVMVGVTPLEALDIWATYNYTYRDKGTSPPPAMTNNFEIYVWPGESRHSVAFHTEWKPEKFNVKFNLYFDKNDSEQARFRIRDTDVPLTLGWEGYQKYLNTGISPSLTNYDKYTVGANLTGGYIINDWNEINGTVQFRQQHEAIYNAVNASSVEHTDGYKSSEWLDNFYLFGVEYTVNPVKPFTAVLGLSLDVWDPQKNYAGTGTAGSRVPNLNKVLQASAATPQWAIGLFYDLTEQHELHFTYAKKSRVANFLERSSYTSENGTTKPATDLKPVEMHNFEWGYKGYFLDRIRVTTAVYLNYERNRIVAVAISPVTPEGYNREYKNLDEFLYYGFEFGTEMFLNDYFTVGGALGGNRYDVLNSQSGYKFIGNIPALTANGYFSITPFVGANTGIFQNIKIMPRFEYVSALDITSSATEAARQKLDGYMLMHLRVSADIAKNYWASFSINNITDELYYTSSNGGLLGYPAAGISVNLTLGAKF